MQIKINIVKLLIAASVLLPAFAAAAENEAPQNGAKVEVAALYYPHWHVYPRGEEWFGKGWTEWEFVKNAKPRFKNHKYTLTPLPGYLDGASPKDVATEIELASNCGIDVFVYDWYWYNGEKIMQEGLEQGFLKAKNSDKMKFALMWANHNRRNKFRVYRPGDTPKMLIQMSKDPEDFYRAMDYCIEHYFQKPNYWKLNGKLFFSIFDGDFEWDGGIEKFREMFAKVDAKLKAKGLPPMHWNAMTHNTEKAKKLIAAGFDSVTKYNYTNVPDKQKTKFKGSRYFCDYADLADFHREKWADMRANGVPYMPIVTRGWDTSLRCHLDEPFPWKKIDYPYTQFVVDNTPDIFQKLLADAKEFAKSSPIKAILINTWNEYTEGSYLMPDTRDSDASLRAIAAVFGRKPAGKYAYVAADTRKLMEIRSATFENLSYGGHYKNKLDVWLPENAGAKTPVVIYFHGGDWTGGTAEDSLIGSAIEGLLANKIAVVCVQYRCLQDAAAQDIFPPVKAALDDAAQAVEFVKSSARQWNIDASKIALAGTSAGAYSAIYAALSGNCKLGVSAVAALAPLTTLDPKQTRELLPDAKCCGETSESRLAKRGELLPFVEKYSAASLLKKCNGGSAPSFVLLYPLSEKLGGKPAHSIQLGLRFQDICKKKNISCDVLKGSPEQLFNLVVEKLKK